MEIDDDIDLLSIHSEKKKKKKKKIKPKIEEQEEEEKPQNTEEKEDQKKKKKKKKIKHKKEEQEKEENIKEKADQKKEEQGGKEEEEKEGEGEGGKGREIDEETGDTINKMNISESMIWRMPGMLNMQSQYMCMNFNEIKIEELVKPYQEKIKKLEDEIREKDLEITQLKFKLIQNNNINKNAEQFMYNNMNSMNMMYQMNNQFNQNNMMSTPMNQFNNNMMNNMFQMMDQMNLNNNQGMENIKIGDNNNEKQPKFLTIRVIMEDGQVINIQSKSDDKMEQVINKFCTKAGVKKEDYYFLVKGKIAKEDSTVEDNEIQNDLDYILAFEKINLNNNDNNNINETKMEKLGKTINLNFEDTKGITVKIRMGLNKTFKDVVNKYCRIIGISKENLIFLLNGAKLDVNSEETLGQKFDRDYYTITVFNESIIGA